MSQAEIDVKNLHFYGDLFRDNKWEACGLHWSVFEYSLKEIARRVGIMSHALEVLPHEPGCAFREWQCSQPDCGETHSTPCNCIKSRAS